MFKLNRVVSAGLALATLWSGASSYLNASCVEPWNELSLSGAWSTNDVRTKVHRRHSHHQESLKGKDINVWKIGVQGHLSTPNCDMCNDSDWLNNFYLRGYGYYGWVTDGKVHRHLGSSSSSHDHERHRHKKIKDGHTANANIGIGYLFTVCDDFAIGPAFGWAYDEIEFKSKRRRSSSSGSVDVADHHQHGRRGRKLTSRWDGPWLGIDFVYNWCLCDCGQVRLEAGYEYHWADFRAKVKDNRGSSSSSHNRHRSFHSKDGSGNLLYANAWWNLCDCWDIGLGFKWRDFEGHKKRHRSSSSSHGEEVIVIANGPDAILIPEHSSSSHRRKKNRARWEEFELAIDLAYNF